MNLRTRVIGVGQRAAGDDGVGLAVIDRLRETGVPAGVELIELAEPSALLELLVWPGPTFVVDALLGSPVGEVVELTVEDLEAGGVSSPFPHGLGVAQAICLSRALAPPTQRGVLELIAIRIARPRRGTVGLSAAVACGARLAAEHLLRRIGGAR